MAADFRNFLFAVFQHLGLPTPTPVQYDIARYLQHGPRRRIIMAFRGIGKSWITAIFVIWLLYRNPDHKVMVVSASSDRANAFSLFAKRLIEEVPFLQHLRAKEGQLTSLERWEVGPAKTDASPSVKSVGITGQLTGSRADTIVADDVEITNNSDTVGKREKLAELVKEFDAVLKPNGQIIYLGTAQTEESIYTRQLATRGYEVRIWPVRYPTQTQRDKYGPWLAPWVIEQISRGAPEGSPVEPSRFPESDLIERELSYGRSGFALQFMLDTSLSDAEKFPLKLRDLIVMGCDPQQAPVKLAWASSGDVVVQGLPLLGFSGDRYHRPIFVSQEWQTYQGIVMAIDPSGRGADELGYAVVAMLNGRLYLLDCQGLTGGYHDDNLKKLAETAKRFKVKEIIVEKNMGDGMFIALLRPHLDRVYPCTTTEVHHSTQKERRIIETLEPVLNQHRLVVDEALIRRDAENYNQHPQEKASSYSLFYQMTRITRDRGAIKHDDRLDALSIAVHYWVENMAKDDEKAVDDHKQRLMEEELRRFMEEALGDKQREGTSWLSLPG
ncbi:phage terminase large subunit [Roseomonas sp. GC11]|uniref:phage terminase large subunit n=1 Tax=Roseomonas sp. GC11 TaxID=2950546 RepID=UPI00210BE816|nr:phage terminase large subunit [Roseomonas sp. GC11]MCQ4158749.1 phage terminase large subunit [Roseomonas sp. GC11]